MIGFVQDLRYAFRMLRQNPMFTAVAVGSLALGIGGNTAIFSLIDQVILRSLPVRSPEQLVLLSTHGPYWGLNLGPNTFSYPMYRDIRDHNEVFSGVAARHAIDISLSYRGQNEHGRGELVSGNYFEVLGVQPALGRSFTQFDDSAGPVTPPPWNALFMAAGLQMSAFAETIPQWSPPTDR